LDASRLAGHVGGHGCLERRAAGGERRGARQPHLSAEELAEIDEYATEADINIWAASSKA
jgi:hypothetical protein